MKLQTEISPETIQNEYSKGKSYKEGLNQYERVKTCERFFEGDQWHGVKTRTVQPVTMNFLRRVVSYFQAMIVSDDIGYDVRPFLPGEDSETIAAVFKSSLDRCVERQKIKALCRESLRDASVDGDSVLYSWFDPDETTGTEGVQGEIKSELLMNTNIIFGNPYAAEVQEQPFLLLVRRAPVAEVRERAKANEVAEWEQIEPDSANEYKGEDDTEPDALCTEITRFWKIRSETGEKVVCFCKTCGKTWVQKPVQTGMTRYPIAYWSWLKRKNSCHGVRAMDEIIPTQIAVNRIWTAINIHIESIAFPKIVYDPLKFPHGWDHTPGKAVAMHGNVQESITGIAGGVPLPNQIVEVLRMMVDTARDCMGASDAALGNVKPDNTSAIIAVQKASSAPLELQRLAFYQFIEDYIRNMVDMMHAYYGLRDVKIKPKDTEEEAIARFDFSQVDERALDLNVEVGAASYWSELTQITNLNNLLSAGVITDAVDFLERVPDGLVPDLQGLIAKLKQQQQDMMAQAMAQGGLPDATMQ